MATGRTTNQHKRVYIDGYDVSGYGRTFGPLNWEYDKADLTAPMSDAVHGALPNDCRITPGTFNGVLLSTTDSGVEISRIQTAGTMRDIMIPIGIRAAPAIGDPVFVCKSSHSGFKVAEDGGAMVVSAEFGEWDASDQSFYAHPWGTLLHINEAEVAVNSSTTDTVDTGIGTFLGGGWMAYQILGGDITGNVRVQSSTDNVDVNFADVAGLTATIAGATPSAGIVETTTTTTNIARYVRWQMTITTGTTLTFAMAVYRH